MERPLSFWNAKLCATRSPGRTHAKHRHVCATRVNLADSIYDGSFKCSDKKIHSGELLQYYQLLDTSQHPVLAVGVPVTEHLSWSSGVCTTSNQCNDEPAPATWKTTTNGNLNDADYIFNCSQTCLSGGNCSEDWQQTFTSGTFPLGIINSGKAGTLNCYTTSCTAAPQGTTH